MKGIVHFLSGVAVATFFPQAVQQSVTDLSFILVLGGVFGLLPDTLDFKFTRFFEKTDVTIDPDPANLDPQDIATRLAEAINKAADTGTPVSAQLHTMKLGADLWRQYAVRFDVAKREVVARIGPVVNTSQMPRPSDLDLPLAHAPVRAKMDPTYGEETQIDIFSGPSFRFEPKKDGTVEIQFIPWHRQSSHSFTLGALLGLLGAVLLGPLAGMIIAAAFWTHVVEDQLGFLGSNLFWPFTHFRFPGLKLIHSGDAIPNFLAVWTALALMVYNLDRFALTPRLDAVPYFATVLGAPWVLFGGMYLYQRAWEAVREHAARQALEQADLVQETQEVQA